MQTMFKFLNGLKDGFLKQGDGSVVMSSSWHRDAPQWQPAAILIAPPYLRGTAHSMHQYGRDACTDRVVPRRYACGARTGHHREGIQTSCFSRVASQNERAMNIEKNTETSTFFDSGCDFSLRGNPTQMPYLELAIFTYACSEP